MKLEHLSKLCILFATLLVAGCHDVEPIEIMSARMFFYNNNTAMVGQPGPMVMVLSPSQIQFVEGWLNENKAGWESHNPLATLLPHWCMELTEKSGKVVGFCRYGEKVVLRDLGTQVEKSLSAQDDSLFIQNIEVAKSKE